MNLEKKYIIKETKNYTMLISKFDSSKIYKISDAGKIIIDNRDRNKEEIIKILNQKYKVETKILEQDYDEFIKELEEIDYLDLDIETITGSDLNELLESKEITNCMIEITNRCQFRCDHCYVDKDNKKDMNYSMYKKIIDELLEINCYSITLTGGEPLLNSEFKKMYIYAKDKGMKVGINTNGYYINSEIINLFRTYKPYQIEVSIYGYNNKSYEEFTHYKNSFEIIDNNIKELIKENINLKLKTVLTKNNINSFQKIRQYCEQYDTEFRYDYSIFPKIGKKEFKKNTESLTPKEILNIIKCNVDDIDYFKIAVNNLNDNIEQNDNVFQCSIGKDQVFIDSYGNIKPCLVVNESYNISETSILEALNKFRNSICKLKFSKNSKCKKCNKKKLCRYCPGKFQLETGSYEKAPKEYCELCDLLISEFKINLSYNLFSNNNLPNEETLKDMCSILVENYNIINNTRDTIEDSFEEWVNMIKNTENYNILICKKDTEIIGFVCYTFLDIGLMLSEVQIKKDYQGKYDTLRKMLKQVIDKSNKKLYSDVYGTISLKNIKSQNVFKHIGFKNTKGILYKININVLMSWINRSK